LSRVVRETSSPPHAPAERFRFAPLLGKLRSSHGFRGGTVLVLAALVLNAGGYAYNVFCIRYLGSRGYGDVAALLALTAMLALPLGSIQIVIAREVAQLGGRSAVAHLLRRTTTIAAIAALVLVGVALSFTPIIKDAFGIAAHSTVVAGLGGIVFLIVAAILFGFLQGSLRFHALGVTYLLSGIMRPALVVPALLLGLGASGALAVNAIVGLFVVALAAVALRDFWFVRADVTSQPLDRQQIMVMLVGSLAFASLTNVDVLLAAYYLDDHLAGVYAAASLVGKAVLFLPGAVVTVLLPKAASRAAAGISPRRILFASASVTALLTLSATLALALVPETFLVSAFGGDFRESTALLGWFGLAMTAAALVNVYLSVYFAERDLRFPLVVVAAAVAQISAVAVWHPDPLSIVLVTLTCFAIVLAVHEFAFPYGLVRVLRGSKRPSATPRDAAPTTPVLPP
jgi:O-antigen/teichoic acid export membrane protein